MVTVSLWYRENLLKGPTSSMDLLGYLNRVPSEVRELRMNFTQEVSSLQRVTDKSVRGASFK